MFMLLDAVIATNLVQIKKVKKIKKIKKTLNNFFESPINKV